MTDLDLGWLAGLIEGEGSFGVKRTKTASWPFLVLGMTDRDVVQRAASLFGLPDERIRTREFKHQTPGRHYRTHYTFTLGGRMVIPWLQRLYPHMGARRKAKIEQLLALGVAGPPPAAKHQRPHVHLSSEQRQIVASEIGSHSEIARKYGISRQTVSNIKASHRHLHG